MSVGIFTHIYSKMIIFFEFFLKFAIIAEYFKCDTFFYTCGVNKIKSTCKLGLYLIHKLNEQKSILV